MLRSVTLALLALLLAASTATAQTPTPLPAAPGSEAEPNQTPDTATPIDSGERIRALRSEGDTDLYRFAAEAGDRVYAGLVAFGNSRLALLSSDGATVIEADDNDGSLGPQSSSIAGATIPAAGTYYLRVDASPANEVMPYDVYLEVRSGEPDERFVSGAVAPGETDRFELDLETGDTVFLSLDLDPERDGQSFNGRLAFGLLSADNGPTDGQPSEAYAGTVDRAGIRDVQVSATSQGATGTYQLSITVIPAEQRSCRTYSVAPSAGEIPDQGAATFPIEVADAATIDRAALRLDLTHTYMVDLDATLDAPAGTRVGLFGDIGGHALGGPHTRMLTLFDDAAATPGIYEPLEGLGLQPDHQDSFRQLAGQQAAGTWNLTLRDDDSGDVGTLARADLILCARPDDGPVETVFSAGFESGDDGFTHSGDGDEWERGTPTSLGDGYLAGLDRCASGTGCFKTDLDGSYEPNSRQDLVSPPISLEGRSGGIYASWAMWYQLEHSVFDHFAVSVEEVGGANARPLFTWAGGNMWALHGADLVRLAFSAGWGRHRADVSEYAGRTIQLRFHLDSDADVQSHGVAIDDVRVYQPVIEPDPARAEDPAPAATAPAPSASVAPAGADEPAISDLQLASRCLRRSAKGRVQVAMSMRLAEPGPVRVGIDRAVGSRARSTCPRANPERNQRYRRVATFRRVTTVRAQAAAVTRRVALDLRLRPGLYRLTVSVGDSSLRRFLRVVG
jgi:subtilisin-like proprotein convertase family protein